MGSVPCRQRNPPWRHNNINQLNCMASGLSSYVKLAIYPVFEDPSGCLEEIVLELRVDNCYSKNVNIREYVWIYYSTWHISLWPATGVPDQCMSLVGYDRPPLQAPRIYIPYKDAVTCRNRAWTGSLPIAYVRLKPAITVPHHGPTPR